MALSERRYQHRLIGRLKEMFPGCIVLKNDPDHLQGISDLTVLYGPKWALLEVKRSEDAAHRPNQDFYIQRAGEMSYGAFIYPENEAEVLHELQLAFEAN